MNPLTVLIVDDELPLREELRLFPWSACSAELIGEAENGAEALELCRKLTPDVVITDITMPVMDGMELFRSIKQEFPHTQVILLTCHSDFEYARDAIKLGALEYLIKISLLDSELEQALDRARQAIDRDRNHRRSEMDEQRWQLSMLLSQAGTEFVADEAGASILKRWQLEYPLRFIRLQLHVKAENEMYVHHEIQLAFSEWEQAARGFYRWIPIGNTDYLLMLPCPLGEAAELQRERIHGTIQGLRAEIERRVSYVNEAVHVYAVISKTIEEEKALFPEIRRVRIPQAAYFYDPSGIVSEDCLDLAGTTIPVTDPIKTAMLSQIRKAAAAGRKELVEFIRTAFVEWACKYRADPDELKHWLLLIANELFKGPAADSALERHDQQMPKLMKARTLAELTAAFVRELESTDGIKKKSRKEVAMAQKIIAERLAEPITLTLMAEEVGLSSFYLSRLFREEVGETFNEYVTRLRIDKAICLLQTTSMKVYEVAEQVGIPSYRYFSVLFRSRTGVAPTDFKKG